MAYTEEETKLYKISEFFVPATILGWMLVYIFIAHSLIQSHQNKEVSAAQYSEIYKIQKSHPFMQDFIKKRMTDGCPEKDMELCLTRFDFRKIKEYKNKKQLELNRQKLSNTEQ